ncbi:hypothetical protein [Serratia sp. Se-RSBMAAmG]|uniref:hypothetical protein n=1 Tax=Serratia sp. Se-RSBMAAmG TaxID=3043305 RepID=UPI0024AF96CA|nr:hypothetical protein [Serratia sp. Se-RSBMAAmG]MDI6976054.1 hypothetical protein [Serratia sp. Se-RSBMAAmG]
MTISKETKDFIIAQVRNEENKGVLDSLESFNTMLSVVIDNTKEKLVGHAHENDEYKLWKSHFVQNKNAEYEVGLWKTPQEKTLCIFCEELYQGIKKLD